MPPRRKILITGEEHDRRHRITIGGKPAWLSDLPFGRFLALAAGRLSADDRPVPLSAKDVWNLRRELGQWIGLAAARSLIVTAGRHRYKLAEDFEISVAPPFRTCVLGVPTLNRHRRTLLKLL